LIPIAARRWFSELNAYSITSSWLRPKSVQ